MKKTIALLLALPLYSINAQTPQTVVADFENLTLAADTFYENHNSDSWQTSNATFRYAWENNFGGLWGSGFAYTNKNNVNTGNFYNQYSAITGKGYNNSNQYVTAWEGYGSTRMVIVPKAPTKFVNGFYVTNTTYSYKTMKYGINPPARAFGDTLHTHSGMQPGNFPDWFKLSIYAHKKGLKKQDSVEFYLADYRFSDNTKDYIVDTWKWVDCSKFGSVDSISFRMFSSDVGAFGVNNPTYFSMDNFTTSDYILYTGIDSNNELERVNVGPNPFYESLNIINEGQSDLHVVLKDPVGKLVYSSNLTAKNNTIGLAGLPSGIYFLQISSGTNTHTKKIIKE